MIPMILLICVLLCASVAEPLSLNGKQQKSALQLPANFKLKAHFSQLAEGFPFSDP
jgi:hypothetical protein